MFQSLKQKVTEVICQIHDVLASLDLQIQILQKLSDRATKIAGLSYGTIFYGHEINIIIKEVADEDQ